MSAISEPFASDRIGCVQSLVRAFGILDKLAEHEQGQTLTQVAQLVSLPRSTTHRLLTTMGALRYVEFDSTTNHWLIGVRAFTVGSAFAHKHDLSRLSRPIIQSLMIEARETVNIAVPGSNTVCFVGQVCASGTFSGRARPGVRLPLHTTALGKAVLAHWSQVKVDHFLRNHRLGCETTASITEPARLLEQLDVIRQRGYATDDQENERGMRCVAVPVFDHRRRPLAAISISGPVQRMNHERLEHFGRTLAPAAQRLSDSLSGITAA